MVVDDRRTLPLHLFAIELRDLPRGELRVVFLELAEERLYRRILMPSVAERRSNRQRRPIPSGMMAVGIGKHLFDQSKGRRLRFLSLLQSAAAVIDQQSANLVLLLVLQIIERQIDLESLSRPVN